MKKGILRFSYVVPGGNDTVLVHDLVPRHYQGSLANNLFIKQVKGCEQVGYLEPPTADGAVCRLQMMGGEFCGNASRATVKLITDAFFMRDPGPSPFELERVVDNGDHLDVPIEVSGYDGVLHAEVQLDANRNVQDIFVSMPVRREADCTEERTVVLGDQEIAATLVHQHGISHLLVPEIDVVAGHNREQRMEHADRILTEQHLRGLEAAGVIFYKAEGDRYTIDPYVFVRDSNTLIPETACGSGTTALAQKLALEFGHNVETCVGQPSGLDIGIAIQYNGTEFCGARINGPVIVERTGTVEVTASDLHQPVSLHRISSAEEFEPYARSAGALYVSVFRDAPYHERFSIDVAAGFLRDIAAHEQGVFFLALDGETVVGFSGAVPLTEEPKIVECLADRITAESAYYMSELGVAHAYRGRGLSHDLINARLEAIPAGFDTIVVRTSVDNQTTQHLYRDVRGYRELDGARQMVDTTKWDEASRSFVSKPDERLFLVGAVKPEAVAR